MNEFGREAFGPGGRRERVRRFVTSGTVAARRFQILPMTIKAGIVRARRGAQVTHHANGWASANERLTREKLLSMASHARVVIGKIGHVREISFGIPRGRNFVATIARQALVLIR